MGFDYTDGQYRVFVKSAPIDKNEERKDSFSAGGASEIIHELLSGKQDIIYKSCEYMVFSSQMPWDKKAEIVTALMNRNEFQLKCYVFETDGVEEMQKKTNDREYPDFPAYYRAVTSMGGVDDEK